MATKRLSASVPAPSRSILDDILDFTDMVTTKIGDTYDLYLGAGVKKAKVQALKEVIKNGGIATVPVPPPKPVKYIPQTGASAGTGVSYQKWGLAIAALGLALAFFTTVMRKK